MKNLEYKDYTGTIEYNKEDGLLYGKVLGIQGLISYEGTTGNELETDFIDAIGKLTVDERRVTQFKFRSDLSLISCFAF